MVEAPESGSCAFCAYLDGTREYVFLWREAHAAVAVTREQRGVSHLLVFPTVHTPTLLDLRSDAAAPLMLAVRDAARTIDVADHRPGIAVWQNNGIAAAQTIGHLHFHVAGTLPSGGTEFGDVPEISIAAAKKIARHLRRHLLVGPDALRHLPDL